MLQDWDRDIGIFVLQLILDYLKSNYSITKVALYDNFKGIMVLLLRLCLLLFFRPSTNWRFSKTCGLSWWDSQPRTMVRWRTSCGRMVAQWPLLMTCWQHMWWANGQELVGFILLNNKRFIKHSSQWLKIYILYNKLKLHPGHIDNIYNWRNKAFCVCVCVFT